MRGGVLKALTPQAARSTRLPVAATDGRRKAAVERRVVGRSMDEEGCGLMGVSG